MKILFLCKFNFSKKHEEAKRKTEETLKSLQHEHKDLKKKHEKLILTCKKVIHIFAYMKNEFLQVVLTITYLKAKYDICNI